MIVVSDMTSEERPLQQYPNGYQLQNPQNIVAVSASQTNFEFRIRNFGVDLFIKKSVYHQYNFIVDRYNEDVNRIQDIYMIRLKYLFFVKNITSNCCYCWLLLSLFLFLSVPTFIYNLIRFITLINIVNTMKYNKRVVPNLFQNMIYCETLVKMNDYYEISSNFYNQNMQVLGISYESFTLACARLTNVVGSFVVSVIFYNNKFISCYTQAPRYINIIEIKY